MESSVEGEFTKEYTTFRNELLSQEHTFYEKGCAWAEKIIKIAPKEKDLDNLKRSIEIAHLNVTPHGAASFASFVGFGMLLLGLLIGGLFFYLYLRKMTTSPIYYTLKGTEDVVVKKNIVYTDKSKDINTLDIYLPRGYDSNNEYNVVLFISGDIYSFMA